MTLPLLHYLYSSSLPKYLRRHANGQSSWALVTGAGDGIGRALCSELCEQGFNIVLHDRNDDILAQVRQDLEAAHPDTHFRSVAVDATSFSTTDIDRVVAQVTDIPLTVLINNVGGTSPLSSNFKHFEGTTPTEIRRLFYLNVLFPLQLTLAILPELQKEQQPTLVVTCGSQAHVGQPYVAAYSSCKGALHAWSRSLAAEQYEAQSQVEILEVLVGPTYTRLVQKDKRFSAGLFMPTATTMARAILARVGYGHRSVVPYFWHLVQNILLYNLLPASVADSLVASILKPSVERKEI